MRMNIYVQDDLAEQVKQLGDVNVSAVCQSALREEIARQAALAKLDKDMKPVEFHASESHGGTVRFVGRELAYDERGDTTAYLTRNHRIALADNNSCNLWIYDSFAEISGRFDGIVSNVAFVAEIAEALGEEHVIELDI